MRVTWLVIILTHPHVTRCFGAIKTDNDGNELVDFSIPEIFEEDQYGPDIREKVKCLLSKACTQPAPELKKITNKYLNPKNCSEILRVLKINRDVWLKLNKQGRTRDVLMQDLQKQFVRGLNQFAKVLDTIITTPKQIKSKEIIPLLANGISIMVTMLFSNVHEEVTCM